MRRHDRKAVGFGFGCAALLLALGLMTGCHMAPPVNGIAVTQDVQYQDIPVPLNFNFDSKESWAYTRFEEGPLKLRSFELIYWGDRPIQELGEWYRDQMPRHKWKLEDSFDDRELRLSFTKGSERAEIVMERISKDLGKQIVTKVTARVGVL